MPSPAPGSGGQDPSSPAWPSKRALTIGGKNPGPILSPNCAMAWLTHFRGAAAANDLTATVIGSGPSESSDRGVHPVNPIKKFPLGFRLSSPSRKSTKAGRPQAEEFNHRLRGFTQMGVWRKGQQRMGGRRNQTKGEVFDRMNWIYRMNSLISGLARCRRLFSIAKSFSERRRNRINRPRNNPVWRATEDRSHRFSPAFPSPHRPQRRTLPVLIWQIIPLFSANWRPNRRRWSARL